MLLGCVYLKDGLPARDARAWSVLVDDGGGVQAGLYDLSTTTVYGTPRYCHGQHIDDWRVTMEPSSNRSLVSLCKRKRQRIAFSIHRISATQEIG